MSEKEATVGVWSEIGKLRRVLVCPPGLAHDRLTPDTADELLYDDVLWTQQARRDHFAESLLIGEALYRVNDALIEIYELDAFGSVTEDLSLPEVSDAQADGIAVADKQQIFSVKAPSDVLGLHDHVPGLHVDLIELSKRHRPVLDHIRDCIDGVPEIKSFCLHRPSRNEAFLLGK